MKSQALFSSKDKSKKLKCRMLQFLSCALKVNYMQLCKGQVCHNCSLKQDQSQGQDSLPDSVWPIT